MEDHTTFGWFEYWQGFDLVPGPVLAALAAVVFALPFLIAGAVIEARHYRRLAARAAELGRIRLLSGSKSGTAADAEMMHGVMALGLVRASVVLAPPPLGRFIVMLRRMIGGRIDLYQRLADRARREALLRLRGQVADLGGDGAIGVRLGTGGIGTGNVAVHAYALAVRGLLPTETAEGTDPVLIPEAAGSPPAPRKRALLILVVGGAAAAAFAGVGETSFFWLSENWVPLKRFIAGIFR